MSTRIFDFSDGFTSATPPDSSGADLSSYAKYADVAAFEAAEGVSANGNVYYNTTFNKVMVYANGFWVESATFEA